MVEGLRGIPMEIVIMGSFHWEKQMEREFISGPMEKYMMGNGIRG